MNADRKEQPEQLLGSGQFRKTYQVRYNLVAGGMAHGIASEALVIAMGKAGFLASFGAAGLPLDRIDNAIQTIQSALPQGPFAINFIHTPDEPADEMRRVALLLQRGVAAIEASAFFGLTPALVHYRAAALRRNPDQTIHIGNRIIAKVSRKEVAIQFMSPAPEPLLAALVQQRTITKEQADMARMIPMADDITAEADSGGHTDRAPLICLLPSMIQLRDQLQAQHRFATPVRVGSAGGIGTPSAVAAAFFLGADYVATGSINQACREADTSPVVKQLLAKAGTADVTMAPAADMFELGVQVQVLKRGTFFATRARKLYDCFRNYESFEAIPKALKDEIESKFFRAGATEIWSQVRSFLQSRNPELLTRAEADSKQKMALLFRWYLGHSSLWANRGDTDRREDYQIWCGPAMGAFNEWVKGTYLEDPERREIADISLHLMRGAALVSRYESGDRDGADVAAPLTAYVPRERQL